MRQAKGGGCASMKARTGVSGQHRRPCHALAMDSDQHRCRGDGLKLLGEREVLEHDVRDEPSHLDKGEGMGEGEGEGECYQARRMGERARKHPPRAPPEALPR